MIWEQSEVICAKLEPKRTKTGKLGSAAPQAAPSPTCGARNRTLKLEASWRESGAEQGASDVKLVQLCSGQEIAKAKVRETDARFLVSSDDEDVASGSGDGEGEEDVPEGEESPKDKAVEGAVPEDGAPEDLSNIELLFYVFKKKAPTAIKEIKKARRSLGRVRVAVSFRRQGSSGLIWGDKFLSGELNQHINHKYEITKCNKASHSMGEGGQPKEENMLVKASSIGSMERSKSNGFI
uniref:Uncharacterized protein LOC104216108 n=1 Tax=Nicotiana sylvestris TaxID=4096 RepID=A0A1U7VHJ5_NICSY|nr:PREDICTED: uncharacterized protein LOC104216108 [Nicotiana sylvestris]